MVAALARVRDFHPSGLCAAPADGSRERLPFGIFPYRGMIASLLLQAFLLFVLIVLPTKINQLRPYAPAKLKPYEVIYYSGNELPRTEDLGGAQSGTTGRAGGREANHPTQTIKVARGRSLASQIVDAPN